MNLIILGLLLPKKISSTSATLKWPGDLVNLPSYDLDCQEDDFLCYEAQSMEDDDGMHRQNQAVKGGFSTCFLSTITVNTLDYLVQIDTGSSDTVLPAINLNSYKGKNHVQYQPTGLEERVENRYADGSWWRGIVTRVPAAILNTTISAIGPICLMNIQSTTPVFADGVNLHGLLGVGFESLAAPKSAPYTLMQAWYGAGAIPFHQIAFHACPLSKMAQAWIDFGNETPFAGCSGPRVAIKIPSPSYYNLKITAMEISGIPSPISSRFQQRSYSILDSCTSLILLPSTTVVILQEQVKKSNGLPAKVTSSNGFKNWINSKSLIGRLKEEDFKWDLLPNISFIIKTHQSNGYQDIKLTLGPRQYIGEVYPEFYAFMISIGGDNAAILGLPFFSAYHIVADYEQEVLTFEPGCACHESPDGYPAIDIPQRNCTTVIGFTDCTGTLTPGYLVSAKQEPWNNVVGNQTSRTGETSSQSLKASRSIHLWVLMFWIVNKFI